MIRCLLASTVVCLFQAFYLPGSVDVNDKQIEDWNVNAPVLYLWSCPDWTPKHKAIAEQHGHLSGAQKKDRTEESHDEMHVPRLYRNVIFFMNPLLIKVKMYIKVNLKMGNKKAQ
ncbi:UNVERIFIED_CONTAM: protein ENHANCED DOWNY MILDEW 2 [Sesamum angustifolium]|uniref:Protein ENHANCED DOWNY MILDEW 2 n=1 Tax=Sesamum angustifolium TaxID=2727405 RepID=A0AAW2PF00_9LAMI